MQETLTDMSALLQAGKTGAMVRLLQHWHTLNEEARETDRQIAILQQEATAPDTCPAEMQQRHQVMSEVRQQCDKLKRQVRDLQVLTEDELNRLRQGRKAIGGYRASNQGTGHSNLGCC